MRISLATSNVVADCERILRTLPEWFGIESSLVGHANATSWLPTFVASDEHGIKAFLSVQERFPESWEINCIAVDAAFRNRGVGKALLAHAEEWLRHQAVRFLQVKTLAASHRSPEYALEIHPTLWAAHLPVLQLIKVLQAFQRGMRNTVITGRRFWHL